ncbi:MAG: helicase-related protein, partial [Deferrisomatales bacterium]
PWRNGRFDPDALARAVETEARMERLWEGWQAHPGARTLVFCCSIAHARFAAGWLEARGVRAAAVHSGPESADRAEALWNLGAGDLDAVCAVDLFNEGVDVPLIDRVVMLRPTESPVVFLQQLGRGLRTAEGKRELQVIDFVGNHRVFLDRVRTLLSLGEKAKVTAIQDFLEQGRVPDLPPGCSVEIELEAVDLLRKLLPTGGDRLELVRAYRDLKASRGRRPSAGELYRLGYNPGSLKAHGSWFEFVGAEGDLEGGEAAALAAAAPWLEAVERRETMTRSYKMVALEALLDADALGAGMTVAENARRSYEIMRRSPELFADLKGTRELPDPEHVSEAAWAAYWEKWPLAHWAGTDRKKGARPWFRLAGGRFEPTFAVPPESTEAVARMTRELVDYRLARYRRTKQLEAAGERGAFEAKVISNQRDPILILPDRKKVPGIPTGDADVRLPDGSFWRFRFVKVAVNVAHPAGSARNELPDLLRRWFGPDAGKPGTTFAVRFNPTPDGWWVEPLGRTGAEVIPFPERGRLAAFPTLKAAAGWAEEARYGEAIEAEEVALPGEFDREKCFAVRASGTSMEGWKFEIRDGDWLVMTWSRGQGFPTLKGRVVLVGRGDPAEGQSYHVKQVVKTPQGYVLHSDNPEVPDHPAEPFDHVVAVLAKSFRPEDLAPQPGTRLPDDELAAAFGLTGPPRGPWSRVDGHLFLLLEGEGALSGPDRVPQTVPHRHPGETAFVLGRGATGESWRYLGVGRWDEKEGAWAIPEVNFTTGSPGVRSTLSTISRA